MTEYIYVTGCDTGFGNILCKMLDQEGFGVFAGCYLAESVEKLKGECSSRMCPLQLDVSSEESVNKASSFIRETLKRDHGSKLHGVVNNAGILVAAGPVEWTPYEFYHRMFNVNVMGTVMVTKSVIDLIRASQGRIVNVASTAGRIALPSQPAYSMSKHAVEAFSDCLRLDMLPWGVTVSIIEPGVFNKTGLYGNFQTGLDGLWKNISDDLKEQYGHEYYQFYRKRLGMALSDFGNTNSRLVPEAMLEALTTKNPKYRYRVGLDSKYLITLVEKLPEGLQDDIMSITDFRNPEVLPKQAPKNGKQIAKRKYKGSNLKYWIMFMILYLVYRRYSR